MCGERFEELPRFGGFPLGPPEAAAAIKNGNIDDDAVHLAVRAFRIEDVLDADVGFLEVRFL